ncbi:9090_t:CDS:2 [Ambispora gerdemannii]|uniref:9090_t:CDS:1 n=1 Tax=Ambispora gerdemannii TaxID=144530 RepID=A0A9N8VIU4_9GLOM|nr:9090_t:CDS:2 [Ambispora gerdemannii]
MFPTQQLLEKVSKEIQNIPNKRKESKRGIHYGLFLLGYKSGLRISEAAKKKGWFTSQKELSELGISESIELSPHTLRRSFATYQAESGMPLPILQKLLGHSSIRTTALYWRNIYGDNKGDTDAPNILAGKKIPKNPESVFIEQESVISPQKPIQQDNSLSAPNLSKKLPQLVNAIPPKSQEKFLLANTNKKNDQLQTSQQLILIPNQREKITKTELILLAKIKNLEQQLVQIQTENKSLKSENRHLKILIQQNQLKTEAKIIQPLS